MPVPSKKATVSLILKLAVILAAAAGVTLSALSSSDTFMGGRVVFMYFTIQSNIAIALVSLIGVFLLIRGKPAGGVWCVIKYVATVSITLTGAVFTFVLAPTLGDFAWKPQNVLTHVVVPLASIIDFFVTGPYENVKKSSVFFVTLPPLAYAIYAGIGYVAGWVFSKGKNYPYFFLNWGSPAGAFGFTKELPFMGCGWWILALLILLIAVGYVYLVIVDALKKSTEKRK
ncbi:MAG: Pr6Pr family membrane protein [Clostridia bacterium]|nr:Pr6Pr family membrane protein [Clostridia bacterium]